MMHTSRYATRFDVCAWIAGAAIAAAFLLAAPLAARAMEPDLALVGTVHEPLAEHVDQQDLLNLILSGQNDQAFEAAFEAGDELFGTAFNALDGVGANVGNGQRFTRVPRMDLAGFGQWANHTPARPTGPNGESCADCHRQPVEDGSGPASENVIRDPLRTGSTAFFINRNTPHLFGSGGVQRLAEEMTDALHAIRDAARQQAQASGAPVRSQLVAKGVAFGFVTGHPDGSVDTGEVEGVGTDLVVRPFQWKGNFASTREFNRDASNGEIGMQAVEVVGFGIDGDFDGVADEMTVGDQTALAVYVAAQPRPTTRTELAKLGLITPLPPAELQAIAHGAQVFKAVGCDTCHVPSMAIVDTIYSEPSQHPNYRDAVFPAGQDPLTLGVDPLHPVQFDLTRDHPDNQVKDRYGRVLFRLGSFERRHDGRGIVRLFGDLKRHDMGPGLAESVDEAGTGAAVFLTENLWGVGSTAPYLHDGRATTLAEAILAHGGEAEPAQVAFRGLEIQDRSDLIAYLDNHVLFVIEADAPTHRHHHHRR
jgi:hypothetical protein